jgi:hypothetical protein
MMGAELFLVVSTGSVFFMELSWPVKIFIISTVWSVVGMLYDTNCRVKVLAEHSSVRLQRELERRT